VVVLVCAVPCITRAHSSCRVGVDPAHEKVCVRPSRGYRVRACVCVRVCENIQVYVGQEAGIMLTSALLLRQLPFGTYLLEGLVRAWFASHRPTHRWCSLFSTWLMATSNASLGGASVKGMAQDGLLHRHVARRQPSQRTKRLRNVWDGCGLGRVVNMGGSAIAS